MITREEFEILKRKPNLSLEDKKKIIFGILDLGWESEYPPFTLEEVEPLIRTLRPKIKLARKIVIRANTHDKVLQFYRDSDSLFSDPYLYYASVFYYIVADLDAETWIYKVQNVLKCTPGIRREIMKIMSPNKNSMDDYIDKKELDIEINERLMNRFVNGNSGFYSRIPGYLTTNRNSG